jgi:hypothetical protein
MAGELPAVGTSTEGPVQALEPGQVEPLLKMMAFQSEAFWKVDELRRFLLLWRRQSGKTTTFAYIMLRLLMETPGCLVTYGSVSLRTGEELTLRVASIWFNVVRLMKQVATSRGQLLETNFDNLTEDDFAELFEAGKTEVKLWHDRTRCSRGKLIAANINTARGFSGTVLLDEIQSIHELRTFLAEVREIASRSPDFKILMAMTIAPDDSHYSNELIAPPIGTVFTPPNPRGHWYRSQAGIMVHRVDIEDAYAAGLTPYDEETGEPITPVQARARAVDKDGFDRNQKLLIIPSGISAIPLQDLNAAMENGAEECIAAKDEFPENWQRVLGGGRLAIGLDPATTENATSNPTGLVIMEQVGTIYVARLVMRFKTSDPNVTRSMLRQALNVGQNRRISVIVVDGSNERFFARDIQREFSRSCRVKIVVSGEAVKGFTPQIDHKSYLGNLLTNACRDRQVWLPKAQWVCDDWRLVIRDKGGYQNRVDGEGNHADTFDAGKLALFGLNAHNDGPFEGSATPTGAICDFFSRITKGTARDGGGRRIFA